MKKFKSPKKITIITKAILILIEKWCYPINSSMIKIGMDFVRLFIFICASFLHAYGVKTPYTVTLTVADKTAETLKESTQQGLSLILSQKSGLIISKEQWQGLNGLPSIESIVEQYHYTKIADFGQTHLYDLSIAFNPDSVQQILQQLNVSLWEGERPPLLLWIRTNQSDHFPTLLSKEIDITIPVLQEAKQRGVSVLFPMGDLQDKELNIDEPFIIDFIQTKYKASQVLCGQINTDGDVSSTWTYYNKTQSHSWESQAKPVEQAISQALDHIVYLTKANSKRNSHTIESSIIEIKDLLNIEDYNLLAAHLNQSPIIEKVDIDTIGPDFMTLRVTHNKSKELLLDTLQNMSNLQSNIESVRSKAEFNYQWVKPYLPIDSAL